MSYSKWVIVEKQSNKKINDKEFMCEDDATRFINETFGVVLRQRYVPKYNSKDTKLNRMINEGLEKGDYEGILLPRISIDEYLAADPKTENVVIAFFVQGVPDAVIPLKNFCYYCNNVLDVDYGDSDTIPNTSIVYIEYDRENIRFDDIHNMVQQISLLSNMVPEDFSMTFPNTTKKIPYNIDILKRYFKYRSEQQNRLAQKYAEQEAERQTKKELEQNDVNQDDTMKESVISRLTADFQKVLQS